MLQLGACYIICLSKGTSYNVLRETLVCNSLIIIAILFRYVYVLGTVMFYGCCSPEISILLDLSFSILDHNHYQYVDACDNRT